MLAITPAVTPTRTKDPSMLFEFPPQQIERADRRHDERAGDHGAAHVVRVLPPRPRIQHQCPETAELHGTVRGCDISHGILHPGIGGDNEESGKPRAQKYRDRRPPVCARTQSLLAIQEQSEKRRFQEEGEHAFHGERLADDSTGKAREVRPVRPELKFHRNAGHHANHEVDPENARPEPGGLVISLVVAPEGKRLQHHDQGRQPHRELRKQVVKSDGEGEVQAVNQKCAIHVRILLELGKNISMPREATHGM